LGDAGPSGIGHYYPENVHLLDNSYETKRIDIPVIIVIE
jgi:hypothetical protein